jgi:hypothetical protein
MNGIGVRRGYHDRPHRFLVMYAITPGYSLNCRGLHVPQGGFWLLNKGLGSLQRRSGSEWQSAGDIWGGVEQHLSNDWNWL